MTKTLVATPDPDQPDDGYDAPVPPPGNQRRGNPGQDHSSQRITGAYLIRLRAQGLTYQQIADEAGYSDRANVRKAIINALDRHEAENANALRAIENERLDGVVRAATGLMLDTTKAPGDRLRAADTLIRASARRARMNGLDAPVQVALSAGVQADLSDALAEVRELLGYDGDVVQGEVTDNQPTQED